ncbi:MAG: hypothetical protein QOF60_2185 [Actinomycetota bacterium]|nr:hypothetical protein [Actinomycetota bacterium]
MAFWFAGLAFVLVWAVFKDPAIDYRLVMLGAVLPDVVDGSVWGRAGVLHTLVASVVLLVVVMLATRGRRSWRRRLLAVPIGTFCHLVLDGMWARTSTFWWPFFGWRLSGSGLPSLSRPVWLVVAQELVGLGALVWCWRRFRLGSAFLRTGRLGREFRPV